MSDITVCVSSEVTVTSYSPLSFVSLHGTSMQTDFPLTFLLSETTKRVKNSKMGSCLPGSCFADVDVHSGKLPYELDLTRQRSLVGRD